MGDRVVAALRALPGVEWVELNRTLSRVVVSLEPDGPTLAQLFEVISRCEAEAASTTDETAQGGKGGRPEGVTTLPGDTAVLAGRVAAVSADAVGLVGAVTGRVLGLPRLPGAAAAAVVLVDVQPRLRRAVEKRIGAEAADVALAVSTAAAQSLAQGPGTLAVDLTLRAVMAAEAFAGMRAWERLEPELAAQAASDAPFPAIDRPVPRPPGPIERYTDASAIVGLLGTAGVGLATGNLNRASDAVLVAAPRATRTARESFAATLSRHLSDDHDVLALRSDALRRLDRVDTLVVDPRAVLSNSLAVTQIVGTDRTTRGALWTEACADVARGYLQPGWHPARSLSCAQDRLDVPESARVLITSVPDPLAGTLLSAARQAGVELVSLDLEELGSLRAGFDDLYQQNDVVDVGLCDAVVGLQAAGHTVALLGAQAPTALAAADVALALTKPDVPPGWTADLLLPDLEAAWRILSALPAARATSRRGVELSAGSTILGGLLMLPGVRGRGPGPVVVGAALGLVNGRLAARNVARLPIPNPPPVVDFHSLTASQALAFFSDPRERTAPLPRTDSQWRFVPPGVAAAWRVTSTPGVWAWRLARAARSELADPLTPILATGAAASALLGSPVDALLVGSVVTGNAILSAAQRLRAERLLNRLLAGQSVPARVLVSIGHDDLAYRDVAQADLAPGDIIEVRAGEVVPADARLLAAETVEVDESSLTGESLPVRKDPSSTPGAPLAERSCMLFEGTVLVAGSATALVAAVGDATEAGRVAALLPQRARDVGIQAQLGRLTARVLPITIGGGLTVTLIGLLRGTGIRQAVTSGVSISVAAVPEGLPLVATLAQQAAARRLTRRGVLVRSPRSIEALGRVDVICFDKTGTLSENRLRVTTVQPQPGWESSVVLDCAAQTCPVMVNGQSQQHATDIAILEAFDGSVPERQAELPFRAGRSFSAAVSDGLLRVKGAPEVLIAAAEPDTALTDRVHEMAARGLRIIAVGERRLTEQQVAAAIASDDAFEQMCRDELDIVGLLGLTDTPRSGAKDLLPALIGEGHSVRVITGDHPLTARTIISELGLKTEPDGILIGSEWDHMSRHEKCRAVERVTIFARMSPEQKVQIVQALEANGHICAMVGDGANDAAAIRAASVGIGVTAHGSDPARGAAEVVLTDGNIGSLSAALDEGDQLWQRVQAALSVLLGGNAGEVAFTVIGTAISGRAPLSARQLLLVNLFTDALPAAAVAVSPSRTAVKAQGGLDETRLWRTIAIRGSATTIGATSAWTLAKLTGRNRRASTVGLVALVASQLGQTLLDSRSPLVVVTAGGSLTALAALISTPGVSQVLGCTPLGPIGWSQALGCATGATVFAGVAERLIPPGARTDDTAIHDHVEQSSDARTEDRRRHQQSAQSWNRDNHLVSSRPSPVSLPEP